MGRGFWPWFLQRATAVLLLAFLGAHLWLEHFAAPGRVTTYRRVAARLAHPAFVALDWGLLALVVFHGLNGARTAVLDLGLSPAGERAVTWLAVVLGVGAFLLGVDALAPFLGMRAPVPW